MKNKNKNSNPSKLLISYVISNSYFRAYEILSEFGLLSINTLKVFLPNYIISVFDTYIDLNLKEHMMKNSAISEYFNINYVIFLMRCIIFQKMSKIYTTHGLSKSCKRNTLNMKNTHTCTVQLMLRSVFIISLQSVQKTQDMF